MLFNKILMKRLKRLRRKAFRVSTAVALVLAKRVYSKISAEHGEDGWPSHSRHGRFKPTTRHMQRWLNIHSFRPRKPKNKRTHTPEQEAAIMTTWVSTLRCVLLQKPAGAVTWSPDDGSFAVKGRFNMDQVGVNFDFFSSGRTWSEPVEAATGFIRVQGSGPQGAYRFGTLHICLGCDLSVPQPRLFIVLKWKKA